MAAEPILLLMGVSGAGKTSVGEALARRLRWRFLDADDLHPATNIEKMRGGVPLDDVDRAPWLVAIGAWIDARGIEGEPGVIACSALKRAYRDVLRARRPQVRIVFLQAAEAEVAARLERRADHFWPTSLLPSQFAELEPPTPDEDPIVIDIGGTPESIAATIIGRL